MKGKNSLDLGGLDPNPDPEEGKPTSGEGDLLLRESTPSFEVEGELPIGIPLLAPGVFWTRLTGVLLRTLFLLVSGTGPGEGFLTSSPGSTLAPAARRVIPWAAKVTIKVGIINIIRPVLVGLLTFG